MIVEWMWGKWILIMLPFSWTCNLNIVTKKMQWKSITEVLTWLFKQTVTNCCCQIIAQFPHAVEHGTSVTKLLNITLVYEQLCIVSIKIFFSKNKIQAHSHTVGDLSPAFIASVILCSETFLRAYGQDVLWILLHLMHIWQWSTFWVLEHNLPLWCILLPHLNTLYFPLWYVIRQCYTFIIMTLTAVPHSHFF